MLQWTMENRRQKEIRKLRCEIEDSLYALQNKADRLVTAMTKDYIKDGYQLQEYMNDDRIGVVQSQLWNGKNHIRVTSAILTHEICVYKNGKFNNKITF